MKMVVNVNDFVIPSLLLCFWLGNRDSIASILSLYILTAIFQVELG